MGDRCFPIAKALVDELYNSVFLQKSLTIFHAALYGGAVITTGLDYFVEHSVMLMWVWDRVRVKESKPICLVLGFFHKMNKRIYLLFALRLP